MKSKPILKVLILFILGMALGAMAMGWYVQRKLDRMHHHKSGKGFAHHMTKMSKTEGDKKEQVYQLSLTYGEKISALAKEFHKDRVELMDSLSVEVGAILNEEERKEFLIHIGKMKKGPPRKKKGKPH